MPYFLLDREWFIKQDAKSTDHKGKYKFTYIEINNFWLPKDTIQGVKCQGHSMRMFAAHIAEELTLRLHEEFLKINRKRQKTEF